MSSLKHNISLRVNGQVYEAVVESRKSLLDLLRNDLALIGTKKGCNTGDCGACTVLLNGKPVNSCLVLAVEANGQDILTIEGMASGSELHPIQKEFIKHGAVQCGYCTSGVILSAKALLDKNPRPTEEEVKSAIAGNLCRCTGYKKIIEAILASGGQGD